MPPIAKPDLPSTSAFPKGVRIVALAKGSLVYRLHRTRYSPIWFGPALANAPVNRFDAQNGQYKILYAAETIDGAFVESILHNRPSSRFFAQSYFEEFSITSMTIEQDVILAKLYDDGLMYNCTDASISTATNYTSSRAIAQNLYDLSFQIDGIAYRSRHDNGELCYALFKRDAAPQLSINPSVSLKSAPQLRPLALKYGIQIDPDLPLTPAPKASMHQSTP